MRPMDSAYDRMMALSHPTRDELPETAVYYDDWGRILVWATEEDSVDDDGARALDVDWGNMTDDEIRAWLHASSLTEV